jgi:hypothetical protein
MKEKYIPGEGCECSARCSCECGCDVDWTPREVHDLREQLDRLAEALREIANEDYRGFRPQSAIIAHKALAAWKEARSE